MKIREDKAAAVLFLFYHFPFLYLLQLIGLDWIKIPCRFSETIPICVLQDLHKVAPRFCIVTSGGTSVAIEGKDHLPYEVVNRPE